MVTSSSDDSLAKLSAQVWDAVTGVALVPAMQHQDGVLHARKSQTRLVDMFAGDEAPAPRDMVVLTVSGLVGKTNRGPLDPKRDINGTAGRLTLTLPAAPTGALLTRVPAAFHGGINDVLLTGLVLAVTGWCRRCGRGAGTAVLMDLEGHGREPEGAQRRGAQIERRLADVALREQLPLPLEVAGGHVHRRPRCAHFPQFCQPPLVAFAACGYTAFEPVRFDFKLGI
mgnify:CR=1 FL=1